MYRSQILDAFAAETYLDCFKGRDAAPHKAARQACRGGHGNQSRPDQSRPEVHRQNRPCVHDRNAGAGAPADGADAARPRQRAEHRRLHFRLSRLAARRLRPAADGGAQASRRARHQVPARRERGPCGDRDLGLAAAQSVARREARRRGRHLVRQGPRRRSLRRRVPPRQYGGIGEARRRALPCRRRSRREIVHGAASVRPRVHLGADAVSLSVQHPRDHRDGAARHRHVALLRLLGRHEGRSPKRSRRPRRSISPTR